MGTPTALPFIVVSTKTGLLTHLMHVRWPASAAGTPVWRTTLCGQWPVSYDPNAPVAEVGCRGCLSFAFLDRYHQIREVLYPLPKGAPFVVALTYHGSKTHLVYVDETGHAPEPRTLCGKDARRALPDEPDAECRECVHLTSLARYWRSGELGDGGAPPRPTL